MPRRLSAYVLSVSAGALIAGSGCVLAIDFDSFHKPSALGDTRDAATTPTGDATPGLTDPDAAAGASDAGSDAPGASNVLFQDDFDRDNGAVGNGWVDPQARYQIKDQQVPVNGTGFAFQYSYLYRPRSDDARDIKVSVEFTPFALPPSYPQVHVRVDPATTRCYAIGMPQTTGYFFGRCGADNNFVDLGDRDLSESLVTNRTYRLSISASGTKPVHLVMMVEKKVDGGFVTIGETTYDDSSADRVEEAGMYGVSADTKPNWNYDNFLATRIGN